MTLTNVTAVPELLREAEFHQQFHLEEKRARRSGIPFVLVVVTSTRLARTPRDHDFRSQIVDSVCSTVRATDICGWYEQDASLAVIFTESRAADPHSIGRTLVRDIQTRLENLLPGEEVAATRVSFSIHPDGTAGKP